MNFGFFDKVLKDYAQKSLDMLNETLPNLNDALAVFNPFVLSYKASALALLSSETRKLRYLNEAFKLINEAVSKYASVSYAPEFMREVFLEIFLGLCYKKNLW